MQSTFLLACFLAVIHFVSASPNPPKTARQSGPSIVSPVNLGNSTYTITWTYSLCLDSNPGFSEVVPDSGPGGLTPNSCLSKCDKNVTHAVIGNNKCFCEETITSFQINSIHDSECQALPCSGNSSQACGGSQAFILYEAIICQRADGSGNGPISQAVSCSIPIP